MIVAVARTYSLGSRVTLCTVRSMKGTAIAKSTLRTVVVPTEHGGWGFTLEPVLLGFVVAPGWPALGLGLATFAAFLARRPLRIVVADRRRERRLERTGIAVGSVAGMAVVAAAGLALAIVTADESFWWPLLVSIPLVLVQLRFDLDNRGRELLPELLGPIALGAAAPMIILATGLDWEIAAGAWLVLVARIVPSILLVRMQIRRAKDQTFVTLPTSTTGVAAMLAVAGAAVAGWTPRLAALGAVLVAAWGSVSMWRPPVPAKTIGWTQMVVGLIVVGTFAVGYHAGW